MGEVVPARTAPTLYNNNNNNNNNNRFTQAHNSLTVNVLGALCSPLKQSIIVQKDEF